MQLIKQRRIYDREQLNLTALRHELAKLKRRTKMIDKIAHRKSRKHSSIKIHPSNKGKQL